MDLRHLEAFVTVAEVSSVSGAARQLGYAQSTVTAHIKSLERDLKVSLFVRSPTGVGLTQAGVTFLPKARNVLFSVADAVASLDAESVSGTLTLGAMESITTARLLPMFEFLKNRNANLDLRLRPRLCAEAIDGLARGELDAAFVVDSRTTVPGVACEVICAEPLVVVAGPDHPLVGAGEVTIEDLRKTRIVGTEPGCAYRDRFELLLADDEGEAFPIIELGSMEAIRRGLVTMRAVALLPRIAVAEALEADDICELAWQVPFQVYTLVLYPDTRHQSARLVELLRAARKVLAEARTP